MTNEQITKNELKHEPEVLASIIDVVRDINFDDFWKRKYFYVGKTDEQRLSDRKALEKEVDKARVFFKEYDSIPSFDTAKPAIEYCFLDSDIPFALKHLKKMIYKTANLNEKQMKERLKAQEQILRASGVPVYLKPLINVAPDLKDYINQHYEKYYDLKVERTGGDIERMVFTDTYFPDSIPIEIITGRKNTGKIFGFCEEETLREIVSHLKKTKDYSSKEINFLV